jgi:putative spermidine/putrescine transport system ATP-binding protein/spermidine/putrescine transport system ATP-binding protein
VLAGSLRTAIFQGTHLDVQLDCAAARGGRVLFRLPPEALPGLAPGQALALAGPARCSAFPPEPEAP